MKSYDRLFIGGEWVAPSSSSVFDVHSPSTGELVGRTPEAMEADIDKAVAAAREAVDHGPWPHMSPDRAGRRADPGRRGRPQPDAGHVRADLQRDGLTRLVGPAGPGARPDHDPRLLRRPGVDLRLRHGQGRPARPGPGDQGADRRGGRHHPVERAASSWPPPSSPRPCSRAARSCSSPPPRRRSTPTCSPRSWPTPASPRACSAWSPPDARSASTWSTTRA